MKKFKQFLKSTWKNVILKRKFKAFAMLIIDKEYRDQLNYLYELTKDCTKVTVKDVSLFYIVRGHKIIYKNYCKKLWLNPELIKEPLKVKWDKKEGVYLVIDGNHRYEPLRYHKLLKNETVIKCEVMS